MYVGFRYNVVDSEPSVFLDMVVSRKFTLLLLISAVNLMK